MNNKSLLIIVFSLNHVLANKDNTLKSMFVPINNRDSGEVELNYPNNMRSERALPICSTYEICSVIHKRYWFKPRVERLCRCPNMYQCPREWSTYPDNRTMALNNLSQLKFCSSLYNLPVCENRYPALNLTVKEVENNSAGSTRNTAKKTKHISLQVDCYCPQNHYWKISRLTNTTEMDVENVTSFRCASLKKCESQDFCGYVRADTYSAYYRCSCPIGHMCLITNRTLHNISELLYVGPAYKASCEPFSASFT